MRWRDRVRKDLKKFNIDERRWYQLAQDRSGWRRSCRTGLKDVKGPHGYNRWECNLAAVWGQMATGTGHSQLQETMGVFGVPVMTKASFISTEQDIGEYWKRMLLSSMAEAGREEKKIAEKNDRFHEGVPTITVIMGDGVSVPISTAIMPNLVWPSLLAKRQASYSSSE